jgi:hypothetical protein
MESIDLSRHLNLIIREAAAIGTIIGLVRTGALKPYLKKNEAFRKFGRARVEHWIESGIVTIRKDGNHSAAWRIDRIEIETVASAEKLRFIGL